MDTETERLLKDWLDKLETLNHIALQQIHLLPTERAIVLECQIYERCASIQGIKSAIASLA